jgi:lipoyl(octanoyl) transferase 2
MSRLVHVLKTGRLGYVDSLKLQKSLSNRLINGDKKFNNILIITEHNPVYTIGLRTKGYSIEEEEKLKSIGAEFHKTNRGGLITFHGPGQLVAYPIMNLKNFKTSVRWYVCHVEKTIINLCEKYGINAGTTEDTGVWIDNRKICAIGIHCSRYVTSHGLALNCNTDLSWYNHIVPCGLVGKEVTSLTKEISKNISIDDTLPEFIKSFQDVFECSTENMSDEESKEIIDQSKHVVL